jgi:hypothetical protein
MTGPTGPTGSFGATGMTGPMFTEDLDPPESTLGSEEEKFILKAKWNSIPSRLLGNRIKFIVFRDKGKLGPTWEETGVTIEVFVGKEGKKAISERLVGTLKHTGSIPVEFGDDRIFDFVDASVEESRKIFIAAALGEWCSFVPLEEVEKAYKEALIKNVMGK